MTASRNMLIETPGQVVSASTGPAGAGVSTVGRPPSAAKRAAGSLHRRGRGRPASLLEWMANGSFQNPSPLLKQTPFAVIFAVALMLTASRSIVPVLDLKLLASATLLAAVATVLAVLCTVRPTLVRFADGVAALDFIVVMVLRHATGDAKSLFGALVLLPTLWVASNIGRYRQYIVLSTAGVALVFVAPLLLPGGLEDPSGPVRALFVVACYAVGAVIVNELARQARRQLNIVRLHEQAQQAEMMHGAAVQQALLPRPGSPVAGYEVAGMCRPAALVGGDFFDWYPTADGLGFTLGDVMGKGVAAGIIAATARAVIREAREQDDPTTAVERTDASLSNELGGMDSFATLFHARLRAADGRIRFVDAGHGLTLHIRADGTWTRLLSSSTPVGVGFRGGWESKELTLAPGDLLVSFSDGVLDFYDGSLIALDHLATIAARATSADDLVEAVAKLAALTEQEDDVTVVVLRRAVSNLDGP